MKRSSLVLGIMSSFFVVEDALAHAQNTTFFGMSTRNLQLSLETSDDTQQNTVGTTSTINVALSGMRLCNRTSSNSGSGLEIAAGGCFMQGGAKTFYSALTFGFAVIYFPASTEAMSYSDAGLKTSSEKRFKYYLMGELGFTKVTSNQSQISNLSIATDILDFGGGAGLSYAFTKSLRVLAEAHFYLGAFLSDVAQGSSNSLSFGLGLGFVL